MQQEILPNRKGIFAQIWSENSILIGNPSRKAGKILASSVNTEVQTLKMDFICAFYRIIIAVLSICYF